MAQGPIPDDVVKLLERPNPAVLGVVRPDGMPVTVATWYLWEDGRILLNHDRARVRLRYIEANPRVSLTVFDGNNWYRHVSVQGPVTIEADSDLSAVDRVSQQYLGKPYPDRNRDSVNVWLTPETYHVWG